MSPAISVLLPTHNQANLLTFAIRSVLAQSFQDFEVLIVGDGCTDNTGDVIRSFNDSRLKWYDLPKAPNFGYANRNIVLKEAKGKLIAYMTHDDLWLSDHLESFLPFFDNQNIEIVYSRPLWVIPHGMIVPGFFNIEHDPVRAYFLEVGNQIPSDCFIHRQECFVKYGYWDESIPMAGDWDFWKRIIKGGGENNFAYLDTPTCLHFKAHWHQNEYDLHFGFPAWKQAFISGQMPAALKVEIKGDEAEQEAIWNTLSSDHKMWNTKIRAATRQVADTLAFQAIQMASVLSVFNDEVKNGTLPAYKIFGFDILGFMRLLEIDLMNKADPERSLEIAQGELNTIKSTLTWKIHDLVIGNKFVHKIYSVIVKLIKVFFSK